ncbi:DUF2523 domain-containing protein [Acinetobacter sp. C26M]|uniref:DUF2523 family protein n=1 Tax=unclassified Acinetobacter TaxID=196816 RepID=UPI002036EEE3|nr:MULTISPECIES: DUF2523 family protein [unclassified Acinetobacter]USA44941.1 DUF2523 domain-containing protein [Acinetobacter sp. C26M]USA48444.1 DUF2523 domain-containing protein [Acinetobacter sp. C26G]
MPALLITILTAFASSLVARLLLGAGLAFVTYNWINDIVANIQLEIGHLFNGLPADFLGLISILKIPQAVSVVVSALGLAAFIKTSKVFLGRFGG